MRYASRPAAALVVLAVALLGSCSEEPHSEPAAEELEALSRTEFTERIENFFEYEPLRSGKPSQFLIHLTDLSDGSPVENAQVTLTVRPQGSSTPAKDTTSRIGKVTGIYVADLTIPAAGTYDIEFHIKNAKLDERLPLSDFKVE